MQQTAKNISDVPAINRFLSYCRVRTVPSKTVMIHAGDLPESLVKVIDAAGGCENLNRHVSGRELCWALREYALKRWGILARTVLESWKIRSTADFGRIVFGFIDFDMMRKQEDDSLDDFRDVYAFDEVFDESFRDQLGGRGLGGNGEDQ